MLQNSGKFLCYWDVTILKIIKIKRREKDKQKYNSFGNREGHFTLVPYLSFFGF
jgi:hypothetical protein